ncbi:hypothetical protein JCM19037_3531 [Geomicrobium sp. JCM 19037]|uniref:DNA-directed RNA polymerase subunit beta n=1 Tax=unclassified Geomicrobium TaxID=2628951 RepID=UPI00045F4B19|nr:MULTISPECIES: DNA-directed RNA polymerase subunit beta [unclassified Geomicrobium]GAK05064.1 hypothetical protein JCM19037_3531 [Geomicrobium sp. JCM 19037]GAK13074.1 hypothetical protein JCM19039_2891 [Geomicrobium sp. JCM 19039]
MTEQSTDESMEENDKKQTRKERRKEKRAEKRGRRIRAFPIWLRLLIVALLFIVALVLGLLFGYNIIGGSEGFDILQWETWTDLYDYING